MGPPVQPVPIDEQTGLPKYSLAQWHSVLQKAEAALQADPSDVEALEWVHTARNQVANVGQQEFRPTSVGEDISSVGRGFMGGIKGIPGGLAQIAKQLWAGDVSGAAGTVAGGFKSMGQGMISPFQLAIREAQGEEIPASERQAMLEQGGQALSGLALADVAAPIKPGLRMGPVTGIARGGLGGALKGVVRSLPGVGTLEAVAERPILKNRILRAQAEQAETGAAKSDLGLREELSRLREEVARPEVQGAREAGVDLANQIKRLRIAELERRLAEGEDLPPEGEPPEAPGVTPPPQGPMGGTPQGGTVAPKGTISDLVRPAGSAGTALELTGESPPAGAATPKPTLADMTGMSNLQYDPGEVVRANQTPVQQLMESLNIEQSPEVGDLTWQRPRGIKPSVPQIGRFGKGQAVEEPTALPEQGLAETLSPTAEMAQNNMANLLKKLGGARRGL